MENSMKKLALWYTKTFKPLVSHDELEPIMATLGFMSRPDKPAQNGVLWKEYVYVGRAMISDMSLSLPKPKLPSQRIDGLHIYTYRAFIDAVNFYLAIDDISNLFHIRGMPLHRVSDRNRRFRRMEGSESVYVYRDGTLDQSTYDYYRNEKNDDDHNSTDANEYGFRSKGNNISIGTFAKLKDIIIWAS